MCPNCKDVFPAVIAMSSRSLLRYLTPMTSLSSSGSTPSLPKEALVEVNKRVASLTRETDDAGQAPKHTKKNYATYSPEDCSKIGQYAAEHRLTKASRHFTVPESTSRLLKKQYLAELNHGHKNSGETPKAVCTVLLLFSPHIINVHRQY